MRFNIYIKTFSSEFNILDIDEEQLELVIDNYNEGNDNFYLNGKQYFLKNLNEINVFTFKSTKITTEKELFDFCKKYDKVEWNIYGDAYIPPEILENVGEDVTNEYIKIGFGEKQKDIDIEWLDGYPEAQKLYKDAMEKCNMGRYGRNVLDDMRLSLELLLKSILGNNKSLENQKEEIGKYLKNNELSSEIRNLLIQFMDYYSKYQNEHIKHNDDFDEADIEFIISITTSFMKRIISIENEIDR